MEIITDMRYLLHLFTIILMVASASGCQTPKPDPEDGKEVVEPDTPDTPDTPDVPDTPPEDTYEETFLTLISYNVANMGHGGDRLGDIARFIQETGADFVGLNEVDSWPCVYYTLNSNDLLGWQQSIKKRGITLPKAIHDEFIMLFNERK